MRSQRLLAIAAIVLVLVVTPLLAACGTATTPTPAPTKAPSSPTAVPPTATPQGPAVGGTVVWALPGEPDTLDVHKSGQLNTGQVMSNVGGSLIVRDPSTGKFVPYLAESWQVADDGLSIEFKLRKDVKFHDGTAMTAADYAWSIKRILDPATKSPLGGTFSSIADVTAPDDYTLRLALNAPSFPLLLNLTQRFTGQPLPRAAVEKAGDQWGRAPIGVGPYKFKQWITGDRIVLERNPDWKWGPAFIKGGPYVQTIVFRVLPESSTGMAGVESGEIDLALVQAKDYERIKAAAKVTFSEYLLAGGSPSLLFNASKAPFDDVRVRQAFLWAVDRPSLVKIVLVGLGVEMHLPTSPTMTGWWAEGEKLGYGYDLAKAKELMKQAGYTAGADGMLEKDGKPLKLVIKTGVDPRLAEVLAEQYKALGVSVSIMSREGASLDTDVFAGDFELCTFSYLWNDFDLIVVGWGTNAVGGIDLSRGNDTALDKLLLATRTILDPDKRQIACQEAQKYILDKALIGPLYAPKVFYAVNNRIKGLMISPITTEIWWEQAYVEAK